MCCESLFLLPFTIGHAGITPTNPHYSGGGFEEKIRGMYINYMHSSELPYTLSPYMVYLCRHTTPAFSIANLFVDSIFCACKDIIGDCFLVILQSPCISVKSYASVRRF